MTKGKIDLDIKKVKEQIAELKAKYAEQKENLANEYKEKLSILQSREKELRQKRKLADDMEKQKMTQNLSVEELQALLAKHAEENKQIIKNNEIQKEDKTSEIK